MGSMNSPPTSSNEANVAKGNDDLSSNEVEYLEKMKLKELPTATSRYLSE